MAFGFLQSIAHSRPLKSFHKKRLELSSPAGKHSTHSAPTVRLCGHFNQKSRRLPGCKLAPRAFYLVEGEPLILGCSGTIPVLA